LLMTLCFFVSSILMVSYTGNLPQQIPLSTKHHATHPNINKQQYST
jgi:hypothetical protein